MSGLGDTVGNFRSLGAAVARLVADLLDGPEPCGHDYDTPVPQWFRDGHERDMRQANETIEHLKKLIAQPVKCPERHYPKWLTAALDESFEAIASVIGLGLTGEQLIWYGDPERTGCFEFQAFTDESSRAEGTQRAQTPGEESGNPSTPPSPGDYSRMPDSELLAQAADAVDRAARTTPRVLEINDLLNLADALRDRAAQFAAVEAEPFVAEEDLAAHITALMSRDGLGLLSISTPVRWGDEIATALLDDFYITKK